MTLHILAEAEDEIESARRFLNNKSPEFGRRFIDELESVFTKIVETPLRFGQLETMPGAAYRRALLKQFRYAVVFEIVRDEILVIAVPHASREPNYWLERHH